MAFVFRATVPVPDLSLQTGDLLVYDPDSDTPYVLIRPLPDADPGAVLAAELDGLLLAAESTTRCRADVGRVDPSPAAPLRRRHLRIVPA